MPLNVELLLSGRDYILAHPTEVDMGTYNDCVTIGCIAFHVCSYAGSLLDCCIFTEASRLLGIDSDMAEKLFLPSGRSGIYLNPGTMEHAENVAAHIDRFIAEYAEASHERV